MKKTKLSWFDKMMIAVTYAEHGALDTVKEITETQQSPEKNLAAEYPASEKVAVKSKKISPIARIANLIKALEDTMTSTAFAEAGEHAAASRIYNQSRSARKKVLLGTDSQELDIHTIGYALKLCQRVEAGLEILHVLPKDQPDHASSGHAGAYASPRQLQTLLGEIGIEYNPVKATASFQNELIDHVSRRGNILCVVVGADNRRPEKDNPKKTMTSLAKAFGKLNCPLVVYEQAVPAL